MLPGDMLFQSLCWVFFQVFFHCLVALVLKPNWPRFAAKGKYIRWSMYNRSVASMHSIVVTSMSIYYWTYINSDWSVFQDKLHTFAELTIDFMTGYLIYDLLHELNFPEKADKETIFHHLLGLATHVTARSTGSVAACNYYMMIYIAELSTLFLHLCWAFAFFTQNLVV